MCSKGTLTETFTLNLFSWFSGRFHFKSECLLCWSGSSCRMMKGWSLLIKAGFYSFVGLICHDWPFPSRPDFFTLYLEEPDKSGHDNGPVSGGVSSTNRTLSQTSLVVAQSRWAWGPAGQKRFHKGGISSLIKPVPGCLYESLIKLLYWTLYLLNESFQLIFLEGLGVVSPCNVCIERNIILSHGGKRKNELKLMVPVASRHLDQRSFSD